MTIDRVILFVSSFSANCAPCVNFVQQHSMPVNIVKLDNAAVRQRVRNGRYFQITNVPTLLVTYTDGNLQLFQGKDKILEWFNNIVAARAPSPMTSATPPTKVAKKITQRAPPREIEEEEEEDEEEDAPPPPRKAKAKTKRPPVKFKSTKKKVEEDEDVELIAIGEDEEGEDVTPRRPQPPPPSKSVTRGGGKGLSISTTANNPLSTNKGKSSGMASLVEQARKMEEDRKNSLGYDEKNLPRYG